MGTWNVFSGVCEGGEGRGGEGGGGGRGREYTQEYARTNVIGLMSIIRLVHLGGGRGKIIVS